MAYKKPQIIAKSEAKLRYRRPQVIARSESKQTYVAGCGVQCDMSGFCGQINCKCLEIGMR